MDNNGNQFNFKLYPPLQNATKGFILANGGNVLEYCVKLEVLSKPRCKCASLLKPIAPM